MANPISTKELLVRKILSDLRESMKIERAECGQVSEHLITAAAEVEKELAIMDGSLLN